METLCRGGACRPKALLTRKGGGGRARAGASRPCLVPVACVGTAGRLVSAGLFFCPTSTRGIVRWRESPRRGQSPVPCARRLRRDGRPTGLGRAFFFRQTFPARLLGLRRRPGLGRGRAASPGCLLCCPLEGPGRPGAWRWRPPTRPGDRRLLRPVNRKLKGARPDGAREHRPTGTHNPSWLLRRQAGGLMSPARPRAGDPGRPGLWIDRLTFCLTPRL